MQGVSPTALVYLVIPLSKIGHPERSARYENTHQSRLPVAHVVLPTATVVEINRLSVVRYRMQLRRKNIEGEDAECNRWTCKGRFVSIQCTVAVLKHSRGRCRAASSVPRLCHPHENRGIHCGQTHVWFELRDRRHDQSRLKLLPIYTHIPQSTRPWGGDVVAVHVWQ